LKKQGIWIGFISLKVDSGTGFCEYGNELWAFV